MEFTESYTGRAGEITALFRSTFSDSEGAAEGELVAALAANLISKTAEHDIFVFTALEGGRTIGSTIFTRLHYLEDDRVVFLLSPVAVATRHQRKGVGQALIKFGLNALRAHGVGVVMTYGDINFYAKVGFAQVGQDVARPPLALQYPEGWLGQSLDNPRLEPIKGPSTCVEALSNQAYW